MWIGGVRGGDGRGGGRSFFFGFLGEFIFFWFLGGVCLAGIVGKGVDVLFFFGEMRGVEGRDFGFVEGGGWIRGEWGLLCDLYGFLWGGGGEGPWDWVNLLMVPRDAFTVMGDRIIFLFYFWENLNYTCLILARFAICRARGFEAYRQGT